jgi:hypothetical protein
VGGGSVVEVFPSGFFCIMFCFFCVVWVGGWCCVCGGGVLWLLFWLLFFCFSVFVFFGCCVVVVCVVYCNCKLQGKENKMFVATYFADDDRIVTVRPVAVKGDTDWSSLYIAADERLADYGFKLGVFDEVGDWYELVVV